MGGSENHDAFATDEKSVKPMKEARMVVVMIEYKTPPRLTILDIGKLRLPITTNTFLSPIVILKFEFFGMPIFMSLEMPTGMPVGVPVGMSHGI